MQQQGTTKRFYIFSGDQLLGEVEGNLHKVAYTWGPGWLVSERLFAVYYVGVMAQADDETGLSGYAIPEEEAPPAAFAPTPIAIIPVPIGDTTLWYHHGPQGETRYLTDPSGQVVDTYLYDGYGNPIFASGNHYNPHRYGGRYGYHSNLNASGLVLAGARWYSPNLRRWASRDPIGYEGGDNLYVYVLENPIRFTDPSGLDLTDDLIDMTGNLGAGLGDTISLNGTKWIRQKLGTDNGVDYNSWSYRLGQIGGIAWWCGAGRVAHLGQELKLGKNLRFAPLGNRTGHPLGELPHYHRRGPFNPELGETARGQGIGRHRPWESSPEDKHWWQRF